MFESILSLEKIQKGLQGKQLYKIADEIGLTYPTLKKLHDGVAGNYNSVTLTLVSDYIRQSKK